MAWRSMDSVPRKGEFMIAEYAPPGLIYRVVHISIPDSLNEKDTDDYLRRMIRYARKWRVLAPPPKDYGSRASY